MPYRTWVRSILILFPIFLVGYIWLTDVPRFDNLVYDVPKVTSIAWMETQNLYWYLHFFTVIPVFILSFDRRVHYYTRWKFLFPAILIIASIFIAWDIFFTHREVWEFNSTYYLNLKIAGLPIEEWLFFVTVPFASIFIYECLNYYIKKDVLKSIERPLSILFIIVFLLIGFLNFGKIYTATTFILTGFFVLYHVLFLSVTYRSRFYLSYLITLVPFWLINGVLTGGYTDQPVVLYNPEEYLGVRIISVPIDDSVYGFLLLFSIVTLYESFKKRGDHSLPLTSLK